MHHERAYTKKWRQCCASVCVRKSERGTYAISERVCAYARVCDRWTALGWSARGQRVEAVYCTGSGRCTAVVVVMVARTKVFFMKILKLWLRFCQNRHKKEVFSSTFKKAKKSKLTKPFYFWQTVSKKATFFSLKRPHGNPGLVVADCKSRKRQPWIERREWLQNIIISSSNSCCLQIRLIRKHVNLCLNRFLCSLNIENVIHYFLWVKVFIVFELLVKKFSRVSRKIYLLVPKCNKKRNIFYEQ